MILNVGVKVNMGEPGQRVDYQPIATKTVLREHIAANPAKVVFYGTDESNKGHLYFADTLTIGVEYRVTGPDPYTSAKWHAKVIRGKDGVRVR